MHSVCVLPAGILLHSSLFQSSSFVVSSTSSCFASHVCVCSDDDVARCASLHLCSRGTSSEPAVA